MTLKHLRSSTADKRPQASGMAEGQLAINTASGSPGLFFKDSAGSLVKVGPVHVGSGAPNASPASGGTSGNSIGEQWLDTSGATYVFKIWDGSAWRSEAGEFVNTTGDTMTGALGIIAGSASTPGLFFSGDTNTGIYSPGADQVAISTGGSGRLFVASDGSVGIGQASDTSSYRLNIYNSSADFCAISIGNNVSGSGASNGLVLAQNQADSLFLNRENGYMSFSTNNTEKLRITSGGLVGVGTSAPRSRLDVRQSADTTFSGLTVGASGSDKYIGIGYNAATTSWNIHPTFDSTGGYSPLAFNVGGSEALRIDTSGRVGVGTTPVVDLDVAPAASTATFRIHARSNTTPVAAIELVRGTNTTFGADGSGDYRIKNDTGNLSFEYGDTGVTTERLRITSAGLVGIGTSSPASTLHVAGTFRNTGQTFLGIGEATTLAYIGDPFTTNTRSIIFNRATGVTDIVNIQGLNAGVGLTDIALQAGGGNVGIGTTNVPAPFCVSRSGNEGLEVTPLTGNQVEIQGYNRTTSNWVAALNKFSQHIWNLNSTTEAARIDTSGRLLVGTSSDFDGYLNQVSSTSGSLLSLRRTNSNPGSIKLSSGASGDNVGSGGLLGYLRWYGFHTSADYEAARIEAQVDGTPGTNDMPGRLVFSTTADGAASPTERMRITQNGRIGIGTTDTNGSGADGIGVQIHPSGYEQLIRSGGSLLLLNRRTDDGELIVFQQDNTTEGSITVSGTTVSYNGAHLSRWSQLPSGTERTEILRGSVLSNIDEMCEWGEEDNEQLNRMKVSDVEGDKNVSGVFQAWDDDDDTYTDDFYCAMTGDFIIRIAEGVTVERGDLLMSAGDGTAKPQDDDIIRSKTIAKVTSTNVSCTYADGSYCVPCVLMAC